jgi:hypothetical protein
MTKKPKAYRDTDSLSDDARRLHSASQRLWDGHKPLDRLLAFELSARRIADAARQLADYLRTLPTCPLCGFLAVAECPCEECAEEEMESLRASGGVAFTTGPKL